MSFRRHYGTGSYGSSLVTSPLASSYGSRGLGSYNSSYPSYSPSSAYSSSYGTNGSTYGTNGSSYSNGSTYGTNGSTYGTNGSTYGSYGNKSSTNLQRSASLPRETRERSLARYNSYSRGTSPARSSLALPSSALIARLDLDSSDSSSSSGDSPRSRNLHRSHTHSGAHGTRSTTPSLVPRGYSRDYSSLYSPAPAKGYIRSKRSKSIGSSGSTSSLSSGYGSNSGSVSERGEASKGSTSSLGSTHNSRPTSRASSVGPENGDVDYKRLYEEQLEENFRVNERLRDTESELRQARDTIDVNNKKNNTRLAMAEADKREKRALERKLSEMEEELKQLQKLKAENEKLKAENRALTRVVSKLTNSATAGMGNLANLSK